MTSKKMLGCDYQGREFGAHYLDSVCIEGYLWDADSGDSSGDGWIYTNGGDLPCPQCNHSEWREYHCESVINDAWGDMAEGVWPFHRPRFKRDMVWMWSLQMLGVIEWAWYELKQKVKR